MSDFSVVIPLYNKAAEIGRALDSVLAQSLAPAEVIVVDDGSTDTGPQMVERDFAGRVSLLRQANAGVSVARNTGIRAARHRYICLLDADDTWEPGHLAELNLLIQKFPQARFYSTRRTFCDEQGRPLKAALGVSDDYFGLVENFPATYAKGYGLVHSSSVCFERAVLEQGIEFPPGQKKSEDIYFWLQLAMRGPLAFSAKPLVRVHLNASNRSTALRGELPYHVRWFLDHKKEVLAHPLGKDIEAFVIKNATVQAYGAVAEGQRANARVIIQAFREAGHPAWLKIAPALLMPAGLLEIIKTIRRKLR